MTSEPTLVFSFFAAVKFATCFVHLNYALYIQSVIPLRKRCNSQTISRFDMAKDKYKILNTQKLLFKKIEIK